MIPDKREDTLDIKSFEKLFTRVQPGLYAYCRKYIDDGELARDFVQESFMSLWVNREQVNSSYESYLFRSLHNRCMSHYRAMKVRAGYEDSVKSRIGEAGIHSDVPYPLTELYLKDVTGLLEHCLEKLPEKCREIFVMSRMRGMSNREIADSLGLSVRTVEAQIYNALKFIKAELKDYLPLLVLILPVFTE